MKKEYTSKELKAARIARKLCEIRGVLVEPADIIKKCKDDAELDFYYRKLCGNT